MLINTRGFRFLERWGFIDDENINRIDADALCQPLKYQRRQYLSNFGNSVTANWPKFIKQLFKLYLRYFPTTLENVGRSIEHTIRFLAKQRSRVNAYVPFIEFLRQVAYPHQDINIMRGFFDIDENWSDFVIPLIRIQILLSEHEFKSFAVVPL